MLEIYAVASVAPPVKLFGATTGVAPKLPGFPLVTPAGRKCPYPSLSRDGTNIAYAPHQNIGEPMDYWRPPRRPFRHGSVNLRLRVGKGGEISITSKKASVR